MKTTIFLAAALVAAFSVADARAGNAALAAHGHRADTTKPIHTGSALDAASPDGGIARVAVRKKKFLKKFMLGRRWRRPDD